MYVGNSIRLSRPLKNLSKGHSSPYTRFFPRTHDIHLLLTLLEESGVLIPEEIK
ncbi:hypothetical protein [Methanospirillum lacunae]|uniref:hypothetical protein n=1 Tax=Methanospirillum lacunae TaxID=668570 RepID=UPI0015E86DAD|nr:hypothetical protein [Methanospirillum lacunae]